ncbi:hypothetical protein CJ030_MR0G018440 [Morella rubra]|uniref:Uncharacterized protein n=1 Tax=Morella rubra TaxID=262757 RepID=A0A6A1UHA3_9ROSI|nr:hypothetical protein CJ030_MR0G018440 [Morella rubra]
MGAGDSEAKVGDAEEVEAIPGGGQSSLEDNTPSADRPPQRLEAKDGASYEELSLVNFKSQPQSTNSTGTSTSNEPSQLPTPNATKTRKHRINESIDVEMKKKNEGPLGKKLQVVDEWSFSHWLYFVYMVQKVNLGCKQSIFVDSWGK